MLAAAREARLKLMSMLAGMSLRWIVRTKEDDQRQGGEEQCGQRVEEDGPGSHAGQVFEDTSQACSVDHPAEQQACERHLGGMPEGLKPPCSPRALGTVGGRPPPRAGRAD